MAKITLASLKKTSELLQKNKEYEKLLEVSKEIINLYPKNPYGYRTYIEAVTNNFTKYINIDENNVKNYYKKYTSILNKEDDFSIKYNEYITDYKEVENLKKIKKELISKFLLKSIYEQKNINIKKEIRNSNKFKINGKKISDIYDLIGGIFFIFTFVFNLIHLNYLIVIPLVLGYMV